MGARRDLRVLVEVTLTVVGTWLLLGWLFDRALQQADASVADIPYAASALRAGVDWTNHLYRFGVVGGSAMQPIGGALPIVQLCAALGISPTTTANAVTCLELIFVAFLGIKTAEALATTWLGAARPLTRGERIVGTWLCAFAPAIGCRVAIGDDILILGLLPFLAVTTLAWSARAQTLNATAVVVAAAAAAEGVSGWGSQGVVYGAVFGAPVIVAAFARRWTRAEWIALAAVAGGILVVAPRLASVVAYTLGGDASRGVGDAVTYSYGASAWLDWLGSVPWTRALAHGDLATLQEQNIPLGPLLLLVAGTRAPRRLGVVVLASALVAILYAMEVWPVSALAHLPVLGAFRVPARAVLPAVLVLAPLALAAFAAKRDPRSAVPRSDAIAVIVAALVIVGGRAVPGAARELVAWLACGATVVALRGGIAARLAFPAFALAGALGVVAFDERFPRDAPHERIEHMIELRDGLIAHEPALVSRLVRVAVIDPPHPYDMSTAFAADVSSIDGVWWPPRRFLTLLAALKGHAIPPMTCVFQLARDSAFPALQQLYNVQFAVAIRDDGVGLQQLSPTNGAAWFPARVEVGDAGAFGASLRQSTNLRAELAAVAWRDDPGASASQCRGAVVREVRTDEAGQRATIAVTTESPCTLVVATNYVAMFAATDERGDELPTFPIDVALTGIAVPAHATTIELAPRSNGPWWLYAIAVFGAVLIVGAAVWTSLARDREP